MLAVAVGSGGTAGGYDEKQLATYVWIGQALIATAGLWGDTLLADRIRTGEVVSDLLRPVPPVLSYLAGDLGRAGFAVLTRFSLPLLVGAIAFDLYAPHRLASYPMFAMAVLLATLTCFGCRYLVNSAAYWLLDARGPQLAWQLVSSALTGLYFPLSFLPGWLSGVLWVGTPFPSIIQAPVDILVERHSPAGELGLLGLQACWAIVMLALATLVQRRAERKLVLQGG